MKYEWRKQEKLTYFPKEVEILNIPERHFIVLEGQGNPNSQKIEALFTVAYTIRMQMKNGGGGAPFEYTVYPLEGVWTTSDGSKDDNLNKDALVFKIMIRQPDNVPASLIYEAIASAAQKKLGILT
ncbi:GyrI-like domain-containing protein [Vagococcus silagei]|uniref:GyrI-like domain-containing protein n=1 Tax=Vagococcus silagei TaxID=2508885 RepID=UPI001EF6E81B|nr:GyrI-like domain-containing protein [Vagococcus silagei]